MTVTCIECGTKFESVREGCSYNAPKYCSERCYSIRFKRNNPEKIKAYRRANYLRYRERYLEENRQWWRKNKNKLKEHRAKYQREHLVEFRKYSRKHYNKNKTLERNRAYREYYLGAKNPKGDIGWLRKAKTVLRNAQRQLSWGLTPEACISRRIKSAPEKTSRT